MLAAAGWVVQDFKAACIHAARGVALREFVLDARQGFADYLLYMDGKALGVIEAEKHGATLTGVEAQSVRYALGLAAALPFVHESTGLETHCIFHGRRRQGCKRRFDGLTSSNTKARCALAPSPISSTQFALADTPWR